MTAGICIVVVERDQRPLRPGEPAKWNTSLHDEPLTVRSRDPEHDTCRALVALGIVGKVRFVRKATGMAGLTMDIETGAGLTVSEAAGSGKPRIGKWHPYPCGESSPASVSTSAGQIVPEAA